MWNWSPHHIQRVLEAVLVRSFWVSSDTWVSNGWNGAFSAATRVGGFSVGKQKTYSLPETNSLHLKIDGWKMKFPFGMFDGKIISEPWMNEEIVAVLSREGALENPKSGH